MGNNVASFVLGIIGLFLCWIPVLGAVMPLLAVILSDTKDNYGVAGKVLGCIGLIPTVIGLVIFIISFMIAIVTTV